ncbi:MAG: TonB-dependent receptor [Bacteroidota bacterium]
MKISFYWGILTIVGLLTATPILAQFQIKGQIVDINKQALEYATVSAFDRDSNLVDGTITDAAGIFSLELAEGDYRLDIAFIGYASQSQSIELTQNIDLQQITLAADDVVLDGVEVTAEQSQMSLQLDKKVFNVGKDLLARGGTATEILDNVPSVTVEPSGTVSLRGNSGVTILINGKPSALARNNALSSIPASSIERVEVITNPSARYESAGNAGIINIVLKADKRRGFNGSATVTAGVPADFRPTFAFNLRREKINFFGNVGARYANFIGRRDSERQNFDENLASSFRSDTDQDRKDKAAFGFVGMDYFIDEEHTLTASYSNYSVVNTDSETTDFIFRDAENKIIQDWTQTFDYREPESYNQIDISFAKKFLEEEKKKLNITFQHDFWFNDETENIRIQENFPLDDTRLRLRTNTIESSRDYLLQADYVVPVGDNGTFETGLRAETRVIKSDFLAENRPNDEWQVFQGFDNELDYFERIGGAYIQYGQQLEKLSYLLGLRGEYTFIGIDLLDQPGDVEKTYTRFFPTANVSYQFQEGTSAQVSYSRRIRRPQFWQLNPFAGLNDPNSIFMGNPDMDPAYTDRVEINAVQTWEKLTFNPAIYASRTLDYFGFFFEQRADGVVLEMPVNLEQEDNYGAELLINYRPTDALSFNVEWNGFAFDQTGQFEDQNFDFSAATWSSRLSINYRFLKTFSFQARGNYQAAYENAITKRQPIFFADFGLSKQFLEDKLTLTLNLRNAFDSRWYRNTVTQSTFIQENNQAWNVRRFGVELSYQFQQGERMPTRRMRGSIR